MMKGSNYWGMYTSERFWICQNKLAVVADAYKEETEDALVLLARKFAIVLDQDLATLVVSAWVERPRRTTNEEGEAAAKSAALEVGVRHLCEELDAPKQKAESQKNMGAKFQSHMTAIHEQFRKDVPIRCKCLDHLHRRLAMNLLSTSIWLC